MLQTTRITTVIVAGVLLASGCVSSTSGESRPTGRTSAGSVGELERILSGGGVDRRTTRRAPEPARTARFVIPVAGVGHRDLRDSFGDPRSGGRSHQGIDIMAPRFTAAVAAVSGRVDSIQTGQRSGKALRIRGDDGRSYFYAHLEQWAEGLREGVRVRPGDLVGYVGNSGNAISTPTHLHFEIRDRRRTLNPYEELAYATPVPSSQITRADTRSRSSSIWDLIFG